MHEPSEGQHRYSTKASTVGIMPSVACKQLPEGTTEHLLRNHAVMSEKCYGTLQEFYRDHGGFLACNGVASKKSLRVEVPDMCTRILGPKHVLHRFWGLVGF